MLSSQCKKHLCCTLRMSNITQILFFCLIQYIIYLSLSIERTQFLKTEIPIFFVNIRISSCMISAKSCSSIISKPNIITMSHHLKSWSYVWVMNDPGCSATQESMLKKNNGCSRFSVLFASNSVYS